jgi:hypothetical protein
MENISQLLYWVIQEESIKTCANINQVILSKIELN